MAQSAIVCVDANLKVVRGTSHDFATCDWRPGSVAASATEQLDIAMLER